MLSNRRAGFLLLEVQFFATLSVMHTANRACALESGRSHLRNSHCIMSACACMIISIFTVEFCISNENMNIHQVRIIWPVQNCKAVQFQHYCVAFCCIFYCQRNRLVSGSEWNQKTRRKNLRWKSVKKYSSIISSKNIENRISFSRSIYLYLSFNELSAIRLLLESLIFYVKFDAWFQWTKKHFFVEKDFYLDL